MESAFFMKNQSITECHGIDHESLISIWKLPLIMLQIDINHINHYYFQIANLCCCLAFLASNSILGMLYLRLVLIIASIFLILWSWYIQCFIDAVFWNLLFIAINCVYVFTIILQLKPIAFTSEIEEVYKKMFKPLKVSRRQFKKITNCIESIRTFQLHEIYVREKIDTIKTLSLVISGKFVVSQNGRILHIVVPYEFIDSAEWFSNVTHDFFQISISSISESKVIVWHRDKLKLSILNDQFLQSIFDHIIGRDVVNKLLQVSEAMVVSIHDGNNFISNATEDLFLSNKRNDFVNINLLLNRQSQAINNLNAWRLGSIEENDHETIV